jgi:cell filamentation protein
MDDRIKQERVEGAITFARIRDLERNPVQGKFDVAHLKEIHRRIFQDLPHHAPGEFRPDAPGHVKARALESGDRYYVHYAPKKDIDAGLAKVLKDLNGAEGLRGMGPDQFAARMSKLYGDLDHLHPFKEGNSRTLRTFTSQLAREAGYELHWGTTNANGRSRDRLYIARDREVLERAFPGLDEAKAMKTQSRDEYEAYAVLQALRNRDSLKTIVRENTCQPENIRDAKLFLNEKPDVALKENPKLAGAYGLVAAVEKTTRAASLDDKQREVVVSKTRENVARNIKAGNYPEVKIREDIEVKPEQSKDR